MFILQGLINGLCAGILGSCTLKIGASVLHPQILLRWLKFKQKQQFSALLSMRIIWGAFKRPRLCPRPNYLIALGMGSRNQQFVKLPGDSNVQPGLSTTDLQLSTGHLISPTALALPWRLQNKCKNFQKLFKKFIQKNHNLYDHNIYRMYMILYVADPVVVVEIVKSVTII